MNGKNTNSLSVFLPKISRTLIQNRPISETSGKLEEPTPRKKYRKRDLPPLVNHWGQRKLFLVELEFLTKYAPKDEETIVIYAGAAPGTHIKYLSELFPHCYFILIDPCPFRLKTSKSIEIRKGYFTDEMASSLYHKYREDEIADNLLFLSDIRTANWREMDFMENEEYIKKDNQSQFNWCKILKPDKALLKFRLPYLEGTTEYFDGDLYLSPWGPTRTTETRLVPYATRDTWDNLKYYRTWDNTTYEEQLYYFNTETRIKEIYEHNIRGEGLDKRYDSCGEILILYNYLKNFGTMEEIGPEDIARMSYEVSRHIVKTNRTLLTVLPNPEGRKHFKPVNHKKFHKNT